MKLLSLCLFFYSFSFLTAAIATEKSEQVLNQNSSMDAYCGRFNQEIKRYFWGRIVCNPNTWTWEKEFTTPAGWPLVYATFDTTDPAIKKTTTLIMCGIHGDELPTVYLCVHMVRDILFDNPAAYKGQRVIVAPLINPDGFFKETPTRENGQGIDINRNFPTKDFERLALSDWKNKYRSTPRKYPGTKGGSEIETRFQMMLLERFSPDKIISVHSPYGWLDFDGPSKNNWDEPDGYDFNFFKKESKDIAKKMSKESDNYPLTSFQVFPGSLGNYAATERGMPVYTLELPTSGAEKAHEYWLRMRKGIAVAVAYQLKSKIEGAKVVKTEKDNQAVAEEQKPN